MLVRYPGLPGVARTAHRQRHGMMGHGAGRGGSSAAGRRAMRDGTRDASVQPAGRGQSEDATGRSRHAGASAEPLVLRPYSYCTYYVLSLREPPREQRRFPQLRQEARRGGGLAARLERNVREVQAQLGARESHVRQPALLRERLVGRARERALGLVEARDEDVRPLEPLRTWERGRGVRTCRVSARAQGRVRTRVRVRFGFAPSRSASSRA